MRGQGWRVVAVVALAATTGTLAGFLAGAPNASACTLPPTPPPGPPKVTSPFAELRWRGDEVGALGLDGRWHVVHVDEGTWRSLDHASWPGAPGLPGPQPRAFDPLPAPWELRTEYEPPPTPATAPTAPPHPYLACGGGGGYYSPPPRLLATVLANGTSEAWRWETEGHGGAAGTLGYFQSRDAVWWWTWQRVEPERIAGATRAWRGPGDELVLTGPDASWIVWPNGTRTEVAGGADRLAVQGSLMYDLQPPDVGVLELGPEPGWLHRLAGVRDAEHHDGTTLVRDHAGAVGILYGPASASFEPDAGWRVTSTAATPHGIAIAQTDGSGHRLRLTLLDHGAPAAEHTEPAPGPERPGATVGAAVPILAFAGMAAMRAHRGRSPEIPSPGRRSLLRL